ncbi:hypothetical protein MSPP1_003820 [Malassezia sp. CBS 17886]|nr:hypothetical protein MSPP1_003820 [Malassezia sp. CBS 17886]
MSQDLALLELVGVKGTGDPWVFEAVSLPYQIGKMQPNAFGGCALATALYAAAQTFAPTAAFVPYSIVGHFLSPGSVSAPYICEVKPLRDTRSFITRHVTVKQKSKKGDVRSVFALTLDMVRSPNATKEGRERARALAKEPGAVSSLLRYEPTPRMRGTPHTELPMTQESLRRRVEAGEIHEIVGDMPTEFLGLWYRVFDEKACPEGMMNQNVVGFTMSPTFQDDLPMSERCNLDWMRTKQKLPPADGTDQMWQPALPDMLPISAVMAHAIAFAFAMDGVLAYLPMPLANMSLASSSAVSSLDVAMRFHTDILDANKWFMRDAHTITGGWQRTFSESYFYDENGHLISSCTQQSVLRPVDDEDAPAAKL